ncbi:hypothetical protein BaRGS_00030240 [Batillaria attramentaria]|uniref:Ras/Rap GTPase-activating protein SynGAP-like PH domain-containing protein n=1 Tax=Batillaria attramentaria TaxID=370345 RepID=A0ABD0JUW6_9CAEN
MDFICPCVRVCRDCVDKKRSRKLIPTECPDDDRWSLADSSQEKVSSGEERRSSLPLVASSFFSMKGLRSNLKRTKSVTKLDRKRSASNASENDTNAISNDHTLNMSECCHWPHTSVLAASQWMRRLRLAPWTSITMVDILC